MESVLRKEDVAVMNSVQIKLFAKIDQEVVHQRLQQCTCSQSLTYICAGWNVNVTVIVKFKVQINVNVMVSKCKTGC